MTFAHSIPPEIRHCVCYYRRNTDAYVGHRDGRRRRFCDVIVSWRGARGTVTTYYIFYYCNCTGIERRENAMEKRPQRALITRPPMDIKNAFTTIITIRFSQDIVPRAFRPRTSRLNTMPGENNDLQSIGVVVHSGTDGNTWRRGKEKYIHTVW